MSTDTAQFTEAEREFQFAVSTQLDGVSVSYEGGLWECRSSEHDDVGRVPNKSIKRLCHEHGLQSYYATAHFETGEHTTYVYDPERYDPWSGVGTGGEGE